MKIELLHDLPIAKNHGAIKGKIFDVLKVYKGTYVFLGDAGEECTAFSREVKIIREDKP